MKAYRVWWRDQDNSTPVVVANSYAEALKLAYEEIEVGLSEIQDEVQALTEQIVNTIESLDLPVNITEDTWDDETT